MMELASQTSCCACARGNAPPGAPCACHCHRQDRLSQEIVDAVTPFVGYRATPQRLRDARRAVAKQTGFPVRRITVTPSPNLLDYMMIEVPRWRLMVHWKHGIVTPLDVMLAIAMRAEADALLNRGGRRMPMKKAPVTKRPARKVAKPKAAAKKKHVTSKRELIDTGVDKRYVRRRKDGTFKESDDVGKSLAADRRVKAKTKTRSGQGDKGDR